MKPTTTTFSEGRGCSDEDGGGSGGGAEGIGEGDEVVGVGDDGGRLRTRTGEGLPESMNAETSPESTNCFTWLGLPWNTQRERELSVAAEAGSSLSFSNLIMLYITVICIFPYFH